MLLLKKEKEETQQIMDLCSELLQQEQRRGNHPLRLTPCGTRGVLSALVL